VAITDTYTFNPDVADIVEEAFEIAGAEVMSGNDIRSARRSLEYLKIEWSNRGLNLWRMEEQTISAIVAGTATYNIDIDTISILDAYLRTGSGNVSTQTDLMLTRISEPTYAQIPNKLTTGRPVQYFYNRIGVRGGTSGGSDLESTVTLWPVPDVSSTYEFVYWRMKSIADVGRDAGNTLQLPERFLPAMVLGLAWRIAVKKPELERRIGMLKADYEKTFDDAMREDREKTDFRFVPDMDAYS
jgi:hypothetical protein